MKLAIIGLVLLCILIGVACKASQEKFVPFYPTYEDENDQYYSKKEYSAEMQMNIIQVLSYYNVKHKLDGNLILIPEKEFKNKELMCNYTTKSTDENWLKQHK